MMDPQVRRIRCGQSYVRDVTKAHIAGQNSFRQLSVPVPGVLDCARGSDVIGYRLLGPLEVTVDGTAVNLGGRKQRALLAILLLHANRPVHRDVLVNQLWGEHPPAGAEHAVNVYISRLRKTLQAASGAQRVVTRQGAYLLQAAEEQVDVALFERLAAEGRLALAAAAAGRASAVLGEALALWRGAALADFRFEPFAQADIARLEELRAGVVEDRIEADLALGRHAHVVSELEALVAADPLRERLHQQLMVALYRCGRQADALAAYQKARRTLAEELGIEPCRPLQQTERAILEQDPSLDPPPGTGSGRMPAPGNGTRLMPAATAHPKRMLAMTGAAAVVVALLAGGLAMLPATRAPLRAGPNTVAVIDASRNTVSAVVAGAGRPGGVGYGAGATWVTDTANDQLLRVDPAGQVVDRIPVGRGPGGVAAGGGQVWVANQLDGTVSEVNPAAGVMVATIGVGNGPVAVASGYGSVWAANATDSTLSRIDPGSGRVVATIPLGGTPTGLAAGDGGIWVTSADTGSLALVNPRTNRVSRATPVGSSQAGVAVGAGSIWATEASGTVARMDPRTGKVRTIRLGGEPAGIAYAGGAVWAANSLGGSVMRIDPRTGSVRSIHIGNQPAAITAADGAVLATVLPSPASHRGGTLTLIANLSPHDQATDPALAYTIPMWQMLSVTNDGLVGYRRTGGPATPWFPISRRRSQPQPTMAGPTPSAYALASGIPRGRW